MIAPHTLALLGNLAGALGRLLPLGLMLVAGLYLLLIYTAKTSSAHSNGERYRDSPRPSAAHLLYGGLGLTAHAISALAGATGLLVTSGFTFNETYLYWFPNFAFAFILLGAVVGLHLAGNRWVQVGQICFVATALAGLLVLTLTALFRSGPGAPLGAGADLSVNSWALILLLFVGFDLARLHPRTESGEHHHALSVGVLGIALLFALWGWAAIQHVPLQRLVDTTIAPVLVAKQALGQWGRAIMGLVTIAGTLAAVNGLFSIVAASVRETLAKRQGVQSKATVIVIVLLGGAVAAAMALGWAGTDAIDVVLRAGLLLWLLRYALTAVLGHLAGDASVNATRLAAALPISITLVVGAALIVFTDPAWDLLFTFMLAGLLVAVLLSVCLWRWTNHAKGA
ncbi:MAG: hypothetical protein QNJ22_10630 [Desulfosarcinaceae bacterium]|nr:hypothetical protein [Desulfosarcinaceae bacterium]